MFAIPLIIAQDVVADRRRSHEAVASRRQLRRAARRIADEAASTPAPHRPAVRLVPRPADSATPPTASKVA